MQTNFYNRKLHADLLLAFYYSVFLRLVTCVIRSVTEFQLFLLNIKINDSGVTREGAEGGGSLRVTSSRDGGDSRMKFKIILPNLQEHWTNDYVERRRRWKW